MAAASQELASSAESLATFTADAASEGAVGMRDFLEGLVEIGYTGPLVVEREVGDQQQRFNDILAGVRLLKELVSDLQISGI